jgi:hypothetical protein
VCTRTIAVITTAPLGFVVSATLSHVSGTLTLEAFPPGRSSAPEE